MILWIVVFQVVGFFIGKMTDVNIATWYQTLNKSILTPPEIVFPIIWSLLYVMIALAGWSLWQNRNKSGAKLALFFYVIQVVMNWFWTPIFFKFHLIALGFFWIIAIALFTFITIMLTWRQFKFSACMLLPYLFWLIFASYLNWAIWVLN